MQRKRQHRNVVAGWLGLACLFGEILPVAAETGGLSSRTKTFLKDYCTDCHDADTKKGELDLTALRFIPEDGKNFATWVKVHDRVSEGEMPPKKKARPDPSSLKHFLKDLATPLVAADQKRLSSEGRSTLRRMNRFEYENTLRDLFGAPSLQIADSLPEDGLFRRFNKSGPALDVSHVQISDMLEAAETSLGDLADMMAYGTEAKIKRYYTREQRAFVDKMVFSEFNQSPERATFPVLDSAGQPGIRCGESPITVGDALPEMRDREGVGVVASSYEPIELRFEKFKAPVSGHYKLRFCAQSIWVGSSGGKRWWSPNLDVVSAGRSLEPVTIYADTAPRLLRLLGSFDAPPQPAVSELDVWLVKGESIRPDAARLFRSRPPDFRNPLATPEGQPGVNFLWMEVEGPLVDTATQNGWKLLFGDLPARKFRKNLVAVETSQPAVDAQRLLATFVARTCRRPVPAEVMTGFENVAQKVLESGEPFAKAMLAAYASVLCSPAFLYLEEKPGPLDGAALAARLSYWLWNSEPDVLLRAAAAKGDLRKPALRRAQAVRLLNDPRSGRFVNGFLDYWLDLRRVTATSPDERLYPDYYLDDLLVESATAETRLFFTTLLQEDLPVRNLVSSDFAMLNSRLADHYGLPPVDGVALRRVNLPPESVRGGLLTQAALLKVTSNGTTTSPVLRGAWVMERILGKPPPPPPASVPAIEPDTQGAVTIRQQLEKHKSQESCAVCHVKIDPCGFALESFDVFGGWRDRYRALGDGEKVKGIGKNGQKFDFHLAQPVDPSGSLPDGRSFEGVRALKQCLLSDERQIARNVLGQLVVYVTGTPVSFGDRPEIERILDRTRAKEYGVRSLLLELVDSPLFLNK